MTLRESILNYAESGPFTVADIANDLGYSPDSVRAVMPELTASGKLVRTGTKPIPRGRPLNVYEKRIRGRRADFVIVDEPVKPFNFDAVEPDFLSRLKRLFGGK